MRPGDEPEFLGAVDADEGAEVGEVELVGPASFSVREVGEPFELGRYLGQSLELSGSQRSLSEMRRAGILVAVTGPLSSFWAWFYPREKYMIGG